MGFRPTNKEDLAEHVMVIVGYETKNGLDYLTMKNSWRAEWGHTGYIDVWRNSNVFDYAACPIKCWQCVYDSWDLELRMR